LATRRRHISTALRGSSLRNSATRAAKVAAEAPSATSNPWDADEAVIVR
jgi:hypothetical protein